MKDKGPLVSVVLPVYNRPGVVKTIDSICNQTYKNIEIIIIDNASTDDTVDCIRKIDDKRIKLYINEENRGQTYSINRGLELATGKYIARIDSDDLAISNRIEKQIEFMEMHSDYVLCGSWVQFISDDDELGFVVEMPTSNQGLKLMQTIACGMYHPTAFYRKDVIDKYLIKYDSSFEMAEDYDMWARLLEHGKGLNLAEPLVLYRRGNKNDSRIHQQKMGEESCIIRRRIIDGAELPEKEKTKLRKEMDIEAKTDPSIIDTFFAYRILNDFISNHMDRRMDDYRIIKMHIKLKIYGSCIFSNDRIYAKALKIIYSILKSKRK